MLTSYILHEKRRKTIKNLHFENGYSFDAVTSGYQMTSILYNSRSLGLFSNLEGTAKMDIYSDACQHYNDSLSLLELFTSAFLEQLYPNIPTTEDFVSKFNESQFQLLDSIDITTLSTTELLFQFFRMEALSIYIDSSLYNLILEKILYSPKILGALTAILKFINITDHTWILSRDLLENVSEHTDKTETLLFCLSQYLRLQYHLLQNPWIIEYHLLSQRNLFKKLVMLHLYGGTLISRSKSLEKYFIDQSLELGVRNVQEDSLNQVMSNVDAFFRYYSRENLKEYSLFKQVVAILLRSPKVIKDGIIIENPFMTIKLLVLKINPKRWRVTIIPAQGRAPYWISLQKFLVNQNKGQDQTQDQDQYQEDQFQSIDLNIDINIDRDQDIDIEKDQEKKYRNLYKKKDQNTDQRYEVILSIDKHATSRAFPPCFTHSMDAYLNYLVNETLWNISQDLKAINPRWIINWTTNHDNASVGRKNFLLLKEIQKDQYKKVYNYDYMKTIYGNITNEKDLKELKDIVYKKGSENALSGEFINENMLKYG